jgi:DNA-binding NarL/FixJ family response regulator
MYPTPHEYRPDTPVHFPDHERRIAWRLITGLQNKEIAYLCNLTEGTVRHYLHNMYKKFGVHNRLAFVLAYLNYYGIRPPQPDRRFYVD